MRRTPQIVARKKTFYYTVGEGRGEKGMRRGKKIEN